ncbi:hypothetical protein PF005_g24142 [Phytophthora fragariae]|nr:hypothetical protein PF003_g27519 [Phytophthora fragariae]KAE8994643.1 hypothetical protein PF011_g16654 [Phytophthora fragariae]KAE9178281.1 hypothetical protein PF005_g24142 [Phytophthora fragariae]
MRRLVSEELAALHANEAKELETQVETKIDRKLKELSMGIRQLVDEEIAESQQASGMSDLNFQNTEQLVEQLVQKYILGVESRLTNMLERGL